MNNDKRVNFLLSDKKFPCLKISCALLVEFKVLLLWFLYFPIVNDNAHICDQSQWIEDRHQRKLTETKATEKREHILEHAEQSQCQSSLNFIAER